MLLQMQYFVLFIAEESSIDGRLGFFRIFPAVNRAAVNTGLHVSFQDIDSSRYCPRSGVAGSYSSSICSFLRKLHIVLKLEISPGPKNIISGLGTAFLMRNSSGHCQNIQFCPMARFCHFPSRSSCRAALRRGRVSLPSLAQQF